MLETLLVTFILAFWILLMLVTIYSIIILAWVFALSIMFAWIEWVTDQERKKGL